jgi:type IV pilus assembly protein PilW
MNRRAGFSLVELMLATLIGSLLIAASLAMLAQSRARWRAAENQAALEERALFALAALEQDVQMAGFWGRHSQGAWVSNPDKLTARCNGNDVTAWAFAFDRAVEADNGQNSAPCRAFGGNVDGSDTLTLRHAGQHITLPESGNLYLFSNHMGSRLYMAGNSAFSPDNSGVTHTVHVHHWYVDRSSTEGQLPALRRHALIGNGLMQSQEIIPGIEDMQISVGIDQDEDGSTDTFVDPGEEGGAPLRTVRILLTVVGPLAEPDGRRQRIKVARSIWLRNESY